MVFSTFSEVAALDINSQRSLLSSGDAVERVWAAWALGLCLGSDFAPDLINSLENEPSPGTRRHLAIVLAGLKERTILKTLAQNDPDELVRATACQYLIVTSQKEKYKELQPLLEHLLQDKSPAVRQAVLQQVKNIGLGLPTNTLETLINDVDSDVRELSINLLLNSVPSNNLFPGILEDRIEIETNATIRKFLTELCLANGRAKHVLTLSGKFTDHQKVEFLQMLLKHRQKFAWENLKELSALKEPEIDFYLSQMLDDDSLVQAFEWLLLCIVRAINWPYPRNKPESEKSGFINRCASQAYLHLDKIVSKINPNHINYSQKTLINAIVADLEQYQKKVEEERLQDLDADWEVEWHNSVVVQNTKALLNSLKTLV